MQSDRESLAWAAGLFEGEGCILYVAGRQIPVGVSLVNTDFEVVERFADIVELGRVHGPYSQKGNRKPSWRWMAQSYDAMDVLQALGPWLSKRRLSRAYELTGVRFDAERSTS